MDANTRRIVCTHEGCSRRSVARRLCSAHYQAAWKAGALGLHKKLPPREKNPTICPTEHKHDASLVCYNLHQCRCAPCSTHRMNSETRRRKDKAYGRYDTGLVDADPVRAHILELGEFGIGYKRVAQLAGVGITGVRTLIWGRQEPGDRYGEIPKRVAREKAAKILAVEATIENLGEAAAVSARGAHRRIQALVSRGWSLSKVAERLGMNASNMSAFMRRSSVSAKSHRAVAALYEELWDQDAPHATWHEKAAYTRAVAFAAARRWVPPLAWDDIDTDPTPPAPESDGGIDEISVALAVSGEYVRLTPEERRECVRRLHAERWSDGRIAETIGCSDRTVRRIREELGMEAFGQSELRHRGAA